MPPLESPYRVLVEILNKEDDAPKKKIIACQSEAKAQNFVKLFNLVSAFTDFDDGITEQQRLRENDEQHYHTQFGRASKEDQKRVERWVQNFVIKHQQGKGETMTFANETIGQCSHVLQILTRFFKDNITSLCFTNNTLTDSTF